MEDWEELTAFLLFKFYWKFTNVLQTSVKHLSISQGTDLKQSVHNSLWQSPHQGPLQGPSSQITWHPTHNTDSGVPYLLRPFEVLFTRLELKQKVDKMICTGKNAFRAGENCRGPHLLGKKDPQALECEVRVQDRTKYFTEKHGKLTRKAWVIISETFKKGLVSDLWNINGQILGKGGDISKLSRIV